jgi:hypothetical protein
VEAASEKAMNKVNIDTSRAPKKSRMPSSIFGSDVYEYLLLSDSIHNLNTEDIDGVIRHEF